MPALGNTLSLTSIAEYTFGSAIPTDGRRMSTSPMTSIAFQSYFVAISLISRSAPVAMSSEYTGEPVPSLMWDSCDGS